MARKRADGEVSHSEGGPDLDDGIGEKVAHVNATELRAVRVLGTVWLLPASWARWRGDRCRHEYPHGSVESSAADAVGESAACDLGSVRHGCHV